MDAMLGGKLAEELVYGMNEVTTGASSDLQSATELATSMVKLWAMSEKVGDRIFKPKGDSFVSVNDPSNQMLEIIDQEIKRNLQDSKERTRTILRTHPNQLKYDP